MSDSIISNTSYTNKDFASIYPELLDLVKKLSSKWDPSLSNESDPGVLLIKLNALIADKNNYNIDKNVLECFPTSVTQLGNARRLYDSLGYKMHYYKSATTNVGFQLRDSSNIDGSFVTIPQFTMLTDSTSEIVYTILSNVILSVYPSDMAQVHYVEAIEGKINNFSVNGSENITLDNLDADLRLYFNETNVAENGVFIKRNNDSSWTEWTRVDTLSNQSLNSQVYEFGVLPNSDTCYIQFPEDISNLLGDSNSLNIKYILSNGNNGNIKAQTLTTFYEDITSEDSEGETVTINNQIRIVQMNGTINGEDPEDIDTAYKNYKKTIGTFNTLITRKDYENYLYNAKVGIDYLVSNCVVADRTCDLNYTTHVQTWSPNYNINRTIIKRDENGQPELNAYNIVLYTLNAGDGTYNSTFEPNTDSYVQSVLENMVGDIKAVEHDFTCPAYFETADAIYYLYKNLYALNGRIVTYSKVSSVDAKEIEQNVLDALEQNYDARSVDFGVEPDYTKLIETIEKADSRIKTVALDIPKFQIYKVQKIGDGAASTSTLTANEKLNLVAKMILEGHVQLFKFDDDFVYEFGQSEFTSLNDNKEIHSITTEAKIELGGQTGVDEDDKPIYAYTVKPNESIQLYAPNYVVTKEYSTYVKFNFYSQNQIFNKTTDQIYNRNKTYYILDGTEYKQVIGITAFEEGVEYYEKTVSIPANTDYVLKSGELIKLRYTDENNIIQVKDLTYPTIINCSKEIQPQAISNLNNVIGKDADSYDYVLASGQTLSQKELNKTELPASTNIFGILNGNRLYLEAGESKILQDNEYLLYTNSSTDELFVLGSGTMLSVDQLIDITFESYTDLNEISQNIDNINWHRLLVPLTCTELSITTLGEGSTIELTDLNNNRIEGLKIVLSNTPQRLIYSKDNIDTQLMAKITDKTGSVVYLSTYPDEEAKDGIQSYWIQSRLNLNITPLQPQLLEEGHVVNLYEEIDNQSPTEPTPIATITGDGEKYLAFSDSVIMSGGEFKDASVLETNGTSSIYTYSLKAYTYKNNEVSGYQIASTGGTLNSTKFSLVRDSGIIRLSGQNSPTYVLPFDFTKTESYDQNKDYNCWLLQLYVSKSSSNSNFSIKIYTSEGGFDENGDLIQSGTDEEKLLYNYDGTISNFNSSGSYIIKIPNDKTYKDLKIKFENTNEFDTLSIGDINRVVGLNTDEINVIKSDDNNYSEADTFDIESTGQLSQGAGDDAELDILIAIRSILTNGTPSGVQFDYTYKVPDSEKVLYPTLSSSYWNNNHVFNMYTIPQIDLDNTTIKVNPYSIQS